MTRISHHTRIVSLLAVAATAAATLTACASTNTAESGSSGGDSSAVIADATAKVEQYFANQDAELVLDPVSDPTALSDRTVMYITAGATSPVGTAGVQAMKEIADLISFDLVTFDGEFTASTQQEGLRQAVAQKADVVIVQSVDCAGNEAAFREVHDAGIPIVGIQAVDCDELDPNAESYFDAQALSPLDGENGRTAATWSAYGAAQADYLIAQLDGDVKVVQFDVPDFAVTAALGEGFRNRMAECDTCEIVETVTVGVDDFGPGLQQKAEQVLLKNPDANAVEIAYDDLVSLGISGAVASSGRASDLTVIAGTGFENTLDLIRDGEGLNAGWVQENIWNHYAGVDTALRILSGQEAAVSGAPVVLYDEEHNLPDSGGYVAGTDYVSAFTDAWGL